MAPTLLFALALLAADPAEATAPAAEAPAPEAAPAPQAPAEVLTLTAPVTPLAELPFPPGAPTDDYGLVAWCYGVLDAHMKLHDEVLPEVERIELRWARTPGDVSQEMTSYEEQRVEGVRAIAQFRRAMEAAEKASIRPIQTEGAAAVQKGASVWTGVARADKRRVAQEWMSWGLPVRCVPTAAALEKKASLLGQALNYNAKAPPPLIEAAEPLPEEAAPPDVDSLIADVAAADPEPVKAAVTPEDAPVEAQAPAAAEEAPAAPGDPSAPEETPATAGEPPAVVDTPEEPPAPEAEEVPSLRGAQ